MLTAPAAWRDELSERGFVVLRGAVEADACAMAIRKINLAIRAWGLSAEEIERCQRTTFFPHLRWEPEVWALLPPPAAELVGWQEGDEWAEPQILLRFPDEDQSWPLEPHVDEPPEWADGRPYRGIVGVALSTALAEDGAPRVWTGSHRGVLGEPEAVPLLAGDALVMHPALSHCGALNLGAGVRYAVYFRLLAGC